MKRFIEILLTLLIVMTLIGCQKVTDPTIDTTEPPSTVTSSNLSSNLPDEHTEEYEAVCVDIANKTIFADSYEYTQRYMEYREKKKLQVKNAIPSC